MNSIIKIVGYISLLLISFGTLFKLQHWPGSSLLLIYGNLILSLCFIPLFFTKRISNSSSTIERKSNIFGMISLILLFLGALFKIQHWPAASLMLVLGIFAFAVIAFPMYILHKVNDQESKVNEIGLVILLGSFFSIFFLLHSLNYSRSILTTYDTLGKQIMHSTLSIDEFSNEFKLNNLVNNDKEIEEINRSSNSIQKYIHDIKVELIQTADGGVDIEEKVKSPELIRCKDNFDVINIVMVGPTIGNSKSRGAILKDMIAAYKELVMQKMLKIDSKESSIEIVKIENILDTRDVSTNGKMVSWEEDMFYYIPLSGAVAILSGINADVKNVEFRLLRFCSKQQY